MKIRVIDVAVLLGLAMCANVLRAEGLPADEKIIVGTGKTHVLDSPVDIERVLIASPEVAESVPVDNRTVVINGKAPGETTAILWLTDHTRKVYDVTVMYTASRLEAAKEQIRNEFGDAVQLTGDTTAIYLTGTVKNMFASDRAQSIAATVGKVVNLLKVEIPPQQQQVLLKVRFADVDRSKSQTLGANILGRLGGWPFNVTTGAAGAPSRFKEITSVDGQANATYTLSDALNVLTFDPHFPLLATIQALEGNNVLQILDEPNLLAMNGRTASFLAGGEFPYPTIQGGGSGVGQLTVAFREFGIKLKFTPVITPRGTIQLHLAPEVSSLDFADALTVQGGTVPALTTRRVETDVELDDGQSFAIAGLLDRSTTEALSKIPGLSGIPVLGKLFTSRNTNKTNSELIVIVTPELVTPIPKGQPTPELKNPLTYLETPDGAKTAPRTPGVETTGPVRVVKGEISVQEMEKIQREEQTRAARNGANSPASGTGISQSSSGIDLGMPVPATPGQQVPAQ
ncbi:MAG TPA: pilus assembly protein N-terminal domain-containing protein [Bryobacteraceae bacterium]|nr:pilus assembly protein N-terminal domain-containing protein [Bryobacteraceae bacterium]